MRAAGDQQNLTGAVWMLGAVVSFSAMAVAGRELSSDLDTFEMMMYRSAIGFAIVLAVAGVTGRLSEISTRHIPVHTLRNLAHFTGQNLWFYSLPILPLAQVFALEFTTPLWVILMAPLFLGERLSAVKLGAVICGFIGILIVAQPGAAPLSVGMFTAAGSAVGFALTAVFTKRLTRTESVTCILFYLTALQLIMGIICAGYDGEITLPRAANLHWIVVIALAGLCAHYCITTALTLAPASIVIPVDFIRLPVIAILGWVYYAESLSWAVFLGAGLIFAGNYANILAEQRRA